MKGFLFILACTMISSLPVSTFAARKVVYPLRSATEEAKRFVQTHPGFELGRSDVREFDNGNTFVQMHGQLANTEVHFVAPDILSPDDFMELLLSAHTVHTWGGRSSTVHFNLNPAVVSNGQVLLSDRRLLKFLAVARVSSYTVGSQVFDIQHFRPTEDSVHIGATPAKAKVVDLQHGDFANELAAHMRLPLSTLSSVLKQDTPAQIFLVAAVSKPTNLNLIETLTTISDLSRANHFVNVVTPYFPYARSDKIDQYGVTVTGRLIADLFEAAGADRMAFIRLHAAQAQGFFQIPTVHVDGRMAITAQLKELGVQAIISPDAGFQKDANVYASALGLPVYVINKFRDPITGQTALQKMGSYDLTGQTLAVIDDETASGSTLAGAADFLKSQGAARVHAIVTHLAGNAAKALQNQNLDSILVGNTFPMQQMTVSSKLRVFSMASELGDALLPLLNHDCEPLLLGAAN